MPRRDNEMYCWCLPWPQEAGGRVPVYYEIDGVQHAIYCVSTDRDTYRNEETRGELQYIGLGTFLYHAPQNRIFNIPFRSIPTRDAHPRPNSESLPIQTVLDPPLRDILAPSAEAPLEEDSDDELLGVEDVVRLWTHAPALANRTMGSVFGFNLYVSDYFTDSIRNHERHEPASDEPPPSSPPKPKPKSEFMERSIEAIEAGGPDNECDLCCDAQYDAVLDPCGHRVHTACQATWRTAEFGARTCPYCRAQYDCLILVAPDHLIYVAPDHLIHVAPDHLIHIASDHLIHVAPDHLIPVAPAITFNTTGIDDID